MQLPDIVREDVHKVMLGVKKALKDEDTAAIKDLSNHTIHNASIFQDRFSISVATAVYSLAKILENERVKRHHPEEWKGFIDEVNKVIDELEACAADKKCVDLDEKIKALIKTIASFDEKFTEYVGFVMEKAKIKKGAEMYRHGISLSKVSEVLDVSMWELMDYVGKTKVHEGPTTRAAKQRFEKGMRFFE
jgi:hypothetical protein